MSAGSFIAGLAMVGTALAQERRQEGPGPGVVLGILAGVAVIPLFMGSGRYTNTIVSKSIDGSGDLFPPTDTWIDAETLGGHFQYTIARHSDPLWTFARNITQVSPRFVFAFRPRSSRTVQIGIVYPYSTTVEIRLRERRYVAATFSKADLIRRTQSEAFPMSLVQAMERAL